MRTTTSTRKDSPTRRDLALGATGAQDQLPPTGAADEEECDCCDDCDCPVCVPGCC